MPNEELMLKNCGQMPSPKATASDIDLYFLPRFCMQMLNEMMNDQ